MTSFSHIPSWPLNQYVEVIWVGKAEKSELSGVHHAALFTELIFNYGDTFRVDGQNVENLFSKNEQHIISGLKTEPFKTTVSGIYGSVGIILKPFCYGMLQQRFGTGAMSQVSNFLYENIFDSDPPNFEIVESRLLDLFQNNYPDPDLQKFENYISSELLQKGALKDFNLNLSITQKSFIQKFKQHYLLTPSDYVKLKQVNYAIQLFQNQPTKRLIDIGLDAGFYDQSHFIRVFKKFCGVTPKQFVKYKDSNISNPKNQPTTKSQ